MSPAGGTVIRGRRSGNGPALAPGLPDRRGGSGGKTPWLSRRLFPVGGEWLTKTSRETGLARVAPAAPPAAVVSAAGRTASGRDGQSGEGRGLARVRSRFGAATRHRGLARDRTDGSPSAASGWGKRPPQGEAAVASGLTAARSQPGRPGKGGGRLPALDAHGVADVAVRDAGGDAAAHHEALLIMVIATASKTRRRGRRRRRRPHGHAAAHAVRPAEPGRALGQGESFREGYGGKGEDDGQYDGLGGKSHGSLLFAGPGSPFSRLENENAREIWPQCLPAALEQVTLALG